MGNRRSIVSEVQELDFTEMVLEHLDGDEFSLAIPFLEKARMVMIEKKNFHSRIADECQEAVNGVDKLIAAATEQLAHEEEQEVVQEQIAELKEQELVQEPQEVDISEIRCGNATAADIADCKKYRHALEPIARLNGGFLELKGATALIMAVMNPKTSSNGMKASLSKYMSTDHRWERVNRGVYRLLDSGDEDDGAAEVTSEGQASSDPVREAA